MSRCALTYQDHLTWPARALKREFPWRSTKGGVGIRRTKRPRLPVPQAALEGLEPSGSVGSMLSKAAPPRLPESVNQPTNQQTNLTWSSGQGLVRLPRGLGFESQDCPGRRRGFFLKSEPGPVAVVSARPWRWSRRGFEGNQPEGESRTSAGDSGVLARRDRARPEPAFSLPLTGSPTRGERRCQ